jgi:hypothetical protein
MFDQKRRKLLHDYIDDVIKKRLSEGIIIHSLKMERERLSIDLHNEVRKLRIEVFNILQKDINLLKDKVIKLSKETDSLTSTVLPARKKCNILSHEIDKIDHKLKKRSAFYLQKLKEFRNIN